jgi:diguanylate cyclase (GGDEF)-like protein
MALFEDEQGTVWVGTFGGGLNRFDPTSGGFVAYRNDPEDPQSLSSDRVAVIRSAGPGKLWVGTDEGGLNLFDKATGKAIHYRHLASDDESLSHDSVTSVLESSNGDLWISTFLGLNRWSAADRQAGRVRFRRYSESEGLPNNTVWGVLEDDTGRLWMSSNRGLARFDPRDESFTLYDTTHGLQGMEFNFGAYFESSQGEMFFGGTDGFSHFDPESIGQNRHRPPVRLTSFKKLKIEAELEQPVWETSQVTLSWRDYAVSFEFAALDFANPNQNTYAYRLENFDQDWNQIGRDRRATYTNLEPGEYIFRVIAANNDGVWNYDGLSVVVTMVPPFWKTHWAYALYALASGGLIIGLVRSVRRRMRRKDEYSRKLEREVAARTKELHEAAVSDPLTGLRNRRYLMEHLAVELETLRSSYEDQGDVRGRRGTDGLYDVLFLMIDLDGLKPINDVHGHAAGDQAILQMRDVLLGVCRTDDTLIRWGGDEFLVVSREVTRASAERMAERIRQAVTSHRMVLDDGTELPLSCSIGFTFFPFLPQDPAFVKLDQVVTIADRALYVAKESGRNAWVGLWATALGTRERVMETVGDTLAPLLAEQAIDVSASMRIDELVLDR